jgi:hypothetical protein
MMITRMESEAYPPKPTPKPLAIGLEDLPIVTRRSELEIWTKNFSRLFIAEYRIKLPAEFTITALLEQPAIAKHMTPGMGIAASAAAGVLGTDGTPQEVYPEFAKAIVFELISQAYDTEFDAELFQTKFNPKMAIRGNVAVFTAETFGTIAGMMGWAWYETMQYEHIDEIPRALLENEILLLRSKCSDGDTLRLSPLFLTSPEPERVVVDRGEATCAAWFDGNNPFCEQDDCQKIVYRIASNGFFEETRSSPSEEPAVHPFPTQKPVLQGHADRPHINFRLQASRRIFDTCVDLIQSRGARYQLPAQCSAFFTQERQQDGTFVRSRRNTVDLGIGMPTGVTLQEFLSATTSQTNPPQRQLRPERRDGDCIQMLGDKIPVRGFC